MDDKVRELIEAINAGRVTNWKDSSVTLGFRKEQWDRLMKAKEAALDAKPEPECCVWEPDGSGGLVTGCDHAANVSDETAAWCLHCGRPIRLAGEES